MFSFHGATYIINIWLFQVSSMFSKHSPNTFPSQQMHIHAHNSFQILSLVIFSSLQNSPPELFVSCRDCQPCISVSFLKTILRGHHHPSIEFKTIWLTGLRFNRMWGQYISHPPSIWKHNPPQSWRLWLFHSLQVKACICHWCMKMWILPDQENSRNTEHTFSCGSLAVCSVVLTEPEETVPSQTWQSGFPLCFSNITFNVCYATRYNQSKKETGWNASAYIAVVKGRWKSLCCPSQGLRFVWSLAPSKDYTGRLAAQLCSADFSVQTRGLGSHIRNNTHSVWTVWILVCVRDILQSISKRSHWASSSGFRIHQLCVTGLRTMFLDIILVSHHSFLSF